MDWYIAKEGIKEGRYSAAQVHALLRDGQLALNHPAWCFGRAGWAPIGNISDLRGSGSFQRPTYEAVPLSPASKADQHAAPFYQTVSLKTPPASARKFVGQWQRTERGSGRAGHGRSFDGCCE